MIITIILNILKRAWLPLLIGVIVSLIYSYGYSRGKAKCEGMVQAAIIVEQIRQDREQTLLDNKADKIKIKVKTANDEQASCILSNNPFKGDCI